MSESKPSKLSKTKDIILRLSCLLSLALPFWFMAAGLGSRFGLWDWKTGLGVMTVQMGPILIFTSLGLAVLALILVLISRPMKGFASLIIALLIPLAALGYMGSIKSKSANIPPIHDISTNPSHPPMFSAEMIKARAVKEGNNPVVDPMLTQVKTNPKNPSKFAGKTIAQAQDMAYPEIKTMYIQGGTTAKISQTITDYAQQKHWKMVSNNCQNATQCKIEASATTFWYGFIDDVVIDIVEENGGVRVEIRSISRVGQSDLGANAKRISDLIFEILLKTMKYS